VILHTPPDVASLAAAEEIIQLADAYGIADGYPLAEAQKLTIRNGMGERADGLWAATRIADFGPRQGTGKNDKIAARELGGLFVLGEELLIHTAHEFPTANESFLRLVAVLENWDDLRSKVARIRYANGEQGIELLSGQRLKYRARTGGSGRGFAKADLVVYDEAQHLSREHIAASGPAKLANPNSQTWYAGSGGLATSSVAWAIRRDAIAGTGGRLAYTEMTGESISFVDGKPRFAAPDPDDRDVWYRCINGLGRWVTEEGVEALQADLKDLFPREILCVWDPDATAEAEASIPNWADLAVPGSTIAANQTWALAVSPDRSWASLGKAGRTAEGKFHVEWMEHRAGTGWIVERVQHYVASKSIPLRIHKSGPESALIQPLREVGVDVVEVSSAEVAQATGQLIDAAANGLLVHLGQPSLDKAVRGAVLRMSTDGASTWSQRKSSVEITPLQACTVALGGVPASALVSSGVFNLADFLNDDDG
jgi:hypothetical protein